MNRWMLVAVAVNSFILVYEFILWLLTGSVMILQNVGIATAITLGCLALAKALGR